EAGIARFVYLSSIKANADKIEPSDPYGVSKQLGEKHLTQVALGSGMQAVIVRSPLVYGPGVRANFLRLLQWVDRGWPLPLGSVSNSRILINIWNLCDLLENVLTNARAPGHIWEASDGEDLSTPELIRRIGAAMEKEVRLLPVPVSLLRLCGRLVGRQEEI